MNERKKLRYEVEWFSSITSLLMGIACLLSGFRWLGWLLIGLLVCHLSWEAGRYQERLRCALNHSLDADG